MADGTIEKLKRLLDAEYPEVDYTADEDSLSVDPLSTTGFTVWMTANHPGYTVGFDGWHDEFDDEIGAVGCFLYGLSDFYRLKVVKRGGMECTWVAELRHRGEWVEDSSTGLILVPFWRRRTVEYRHNHLPLPPGIPDDAATESQEAASRVRERMAALLARD